MTESTDAVRHAYRGLWAFLSFMVIVGILLFGLRFLGEVHHRQSLLGQPPDERCNGSTDCDRKGLVAEVRQANAAEDSFYLGVWQVVVGATGIYFVWQTLRATRAAVAEANAGTMAAREALDLSKKALEADHRAWVSIENIRVCSSLSYHADNGWGVTLEFALKNIGRSPAIGVFPHFRFIVPRRQSFDINQLHREFCDGLKKDDDPTPFGSVLFPDQPLVQPVSTNIGKPELADAIEIPNDQIILSPWIIGAVCYRSSGSDRVHQTRFMMQLMQQKLAIFVDANPAPGTEIPVGQLQLVTFPMGWDAD